MSISNKRIAHRLVHEASGGQLEQEVVMFHPNNNFESLFFTKYNGHNIHVAQVDTDIVRRRVVGKMLVFIVLTALDPERIDDEVTVGRAIKSLIKDINDQAEITTEIVEAEDIRLLDDHDPFIMHLGNGEYVAIVRYSGDIPADEPVVETGSDQWLALSGIPLRSAGY